MATAKKTAAKKVVAKKKATKTKVAQSSTPSNLEGDEKLMEKAIASLPTAKNIIITRTGTQKNKVVKEANQRARSNWPFPVSSRP